MAAAELVPGVFSTLFAGMSAEATLRAGVALEDVALGVERQAQHNASTGSHAYGTPTPARPGTGPATISRTLVESVTYSVPVPHGYDWVSRVGPRSGRYPTYPRGGGTFTSKTPSSRYGGYLERGLRNGATYPWLGPALKISHVLVPVAFGRVFASAWR